jgi:hypothetical protein
MRAADERPGPRKQCFLPDQEPSGRLTFAFDSIRPRGSSSNSSSNWRQTASDNRTLPASSVGRQRPSALKRTLGQDHNQGANRRALASPACRVRAAAEAAENVHRNSAKIDHESRLSVRHASIRMPHNKPQPQTRAWGRAWNTPATSSPASFVPPRLERWSVSVETRSGVVLSDKLAARCA